MAGPADSNYLNAAEFEQPHWRVIAQGLDTERWFADGQGVGTGGILMPKPTSLRAGQYYYRFASSSTDRSAQYGGGWWLEFEEFKKISQFADQHGYRLRESARMMLALPYAWTKVDILIKAMLLHPLRAYTGEGKRAMAVGADADKNTAWTPLQHVNIRQLYVPGLYVKGRTHQLYETAFRQLPERLKL